MGWVGGVSICRDLSIKICSMCQSVPDSRRRSISLGSASVMMPILRQIYCARFKHFFNFSTVSSIFNHQSEHHVPICPWFSRIIFWHPNGSSLYFWLLTAFLCLVPICPCMVPTCPWLTKNRLPHPMKKLSTNVIKVSIFDVPICPCIVPTCPSYGANLSLYCANLSLLRCQSVPLVCQSVPDCLCKIMIIKRKKAS